MALPIAAALFVAIFVSISLFGYKHYLKAARMVEQLEVPLSMGLGRESSGDPRQPGVGARFLVSMGRIFPISPPELALTRRLLIGAGFRKEHMVPLFYGIRLLATATCVILAVAFRGAITDNAVLRIVCIAAGAPAGYFGPGLLLESYIQRRRQRIQLSLPDALDLLVVCTEAGCALDMAILRVSQELSPVHPEICEELSLISLEMLAGKARAECLRNFASRTGDAEVKKLVAVLIQTDKFGTSVAEALRTQAGYLRTRRRQEAEERAGKVGVKLVFPIFFFCLPSLFIVTAGPGILQLIKNLFPMMKEFR